MNEIELEYEVHPLEGESNPVSIWESRGMTSRPPKDASRWDDATGVRKWRISPVSTTCLRSIEARYDRPPSGRHDRQWWYIYSIFGMTRGHCLQEYHSNESTKNGVSGNVIVGIYQIRRLDEDIPVILSGGRFFSGWSRRISGIEDNYRNYEIHWHGHPFRAVIRKARDSFRISGFALVNAAFLIWSQNNESFDAAVIILVEQREKTVRSLKQPRSFPSDRDEAKESLGNQ